MQSLAILACNQNSENQMQINYNYEPWPYSNRAVEAAIFLILPVICIKCALKLFT